MTEQQTTSPADKKAKTTMAAQFPGDEFWKEEWKASFGEAAIQKRLSPKNAQFTLYSSWFCPFAQRAWIVAEEVADKNDADYQWVEINPYEVDPNKQGGYTKLALSLDDKAKLHPGFIEASPRGLVPAASHKDDDKSTKAVWESMPAAEYLDAAFGSGTLAGTTPYERARIQIWSAHCTDRIQKQYYTALMSQDETAFGKAMEQCYKELRALAQAMSNEGPFFLGSRFSLVDVAFAPFWQRMLWVGTFYMNLTFPDDEPELQRIHQWWDACQQRPCIRNTLVCKERLIASYKDYYEGTATSDVAKSLK